MCDMNCSACSGCGNALPMAQEHFKYDYQTYSTPGVVLLGLTNRCNLACPYCFVRQSNSDMSMEVAEAAVELMLKNAELHGTEPQVIFFGGEPLLMFDEIIVPLMDKYKDKVHKWGITTNGALLDEDKVDFFYKRGVEPLLSFDGIKMVQDKQRPGKGFSSYERVMENLPYILFRFPEITLRSTITKESLPYVYQTFMMFDELGVKNVYMAPNQFEEWTDVEGRLWYQQLEKIALLTYQRLRKKQDVTRFMPLVNFVRSIWKIERDGPLFANSILRCGLGTTTFSVTPDGQIVPCQERVSNPTFVIGDVFNGIDEARHQDFLEFYWNSVNTLHCSKDCHNMARFMCFGDTCPATLENTMFKMTSTSCIMKRWGWTMGYRLYHLTYGTIDPVINDFFYRGLENENC